MFFQPTVFDTPKKVHDEVTPATAKTTKVTPAKPVTAEPDTTAQVTRAAPTTSKVTLENVTVKLPLTVKIKTLILTHTCSS